MEVCWWRCAGGGVLVEVCADGGVLMEVCWWRCAGGGVCYVCVLLSLLESPSVGTQSDHHDDEDPAVYQGPPT